MEVVCGSERFTPDRTPCLRELGTLGFMKVIKKDRNQAAALAVGRKCRKNTGVADSFEVLHSNHWGVSVQTRWCIGTVYIVGSQVFDH